MQALDGSVMGTIRNMKKAVSKSAIGKENGTKYYIIVEIRKTAYHITYLHDFNRNLISRFLLKFNFHDTCIFIYCILYLFIHFSFIANRSETGKNSFLENYCYMLIVVLLADDINSIYKREGVL